MDLAGYHYIHRAKEAYMIYFVISRSFPKVLFHSEIT